MENEEIIYEYYEGNNSSYQSKLRRIGTEKQFEREAKIRKKRGYGFFKLYYSSVDIGRIVTRGELDEANEEVE